MLLDCAYCYKLRFHGDPTEEIELVIGEIAGYPITFAALQASNKIRAPEGSTWRFKLDKYSGFDVVSGWCFTTHPDEASVNLHALGRHMQTGGLDVVVIQSDILVKPGVYPKPANSFYTSIVRPAEWLIFNRLFWLNVKSVPAESISAADVTEALLLMRKSFSATPVRTVADTYWERQTLYLKLRFSLSRAEYRRLRLLLRF